MLLAGMEACYEEDYDFIASKEELCAAKKGVELITDKSEFKYGELPLSLYIAEGKPMKRKNEIMYEYVFDNYINTLSDIVNEFRKIAQIEKARVGIFELKHNCLPVIILHGKYPFVRKTTEEKLSDNERKIIDVLDSFNEFGLSASVNISTPKIMSIISYADWDVIE